jgi:hypothetical protein
MVYAADGTEGELSDLRGKNRFPKIEHIVWKRLHEMFRASNCEQPRVRNDANFCPVVLLLFETCLVICKLCKGFQFKGESVSKYKKCVFGHKNSARS